jgi:hypothetical protein
MLEMYILEGGYCGFYRKYPEFCEGGYISMHELPEKLQLASDFIEH